MRRENLAVSSPEAMVEPSASPARQPKWVAGLLVLLLAVTFAMRVWNGSAGLDAGRFFDERFSLRNVEMILVDGSTRPANAFYGSLSYLPQTAALWVSQQLHELTGMEIFAIFNDRAGDGWSRTAYFIVRLVCAIFGTLSVWLTFILGRRLFDARVGLLGAALLSAFPRHVLASTEFKPDILVVLLVALTFLWSLDVVRQPSLRAFLWAGAGVGMAVAAKYTGVGVAIPLTVGVLYGGWRERRTWGWLIGAGAASIVTFALLNIHLAVIIEYLPRIWRIMETKGDATGGSRWDVLAIEAEFLVRHHRWPVMLFVIAGCIGMVRRAWDRGTDYLPRVSAIMLLSYIFGYSLLYAAATKLFKGQNYLPVAVFTSLLAAWAMLGAWDRLVARWSGLRAWPLATLLWGAFLVYAFAYPYDIVYKDVVPSTQRRAEKLISQNLRPLQLRHVFYETLERPLVASTPSGHWLPTIPRDQLFEIEPRRLDGSDAELFYAERLESDTATEYLQRATRQGVRTVRIDPAWLKAHGPSLVLLLHPWKMVGEPKPIALEDDGGNTYRALGERPDDWQATSLSIWLPLHTGAAKPQQVTIEGQDIPLFRTRRGGRRAHYTTPRFILGRSTAEPQTTAIDGPLAPPPTDAAAGGDGSESGEPPTQREDLVLSFDSDLRLEWAPEVRVVRWNP